MLRLINSFYAKCSRSTSASTRKLHSRVIFIFFCVLSDDLVFGLNILHRFSFDTVSSAFFSVDSFFVLRYGALTMVIKLSGL